MAEHAHTIIRHPRPMETVDPSRRAKVYDQLNDVCSDWEPERCADNYRKFADLERDGVVNWDGLLLSGWCALEEWDRERRDVLVATPLARRAAPPALIGPPGSGYDLTEFGLYTQEDEARIGKAIGTVRPKPSRRMQSGRLPGREVLQFTFDPPLDPTDHLFVLIELQKELQRRHAVASMHDRAESTA